MANPYEALQNVNFYGQAVQFLLESEGLSCDFTSNADGTQENANDSPVEDDDLFQCGKCKKHFNSFQLFLLHKKEHKQGHPPKLPNSSILPPSDDNRNSASETLHCQLTVDSVGAESTEIENPVILSENDILSFAIDQAPLDICTATEFLEHSTTTRLPSIHCLTKHARMLKMGETINGNSVEDLHFPAPVNESANGHCEILLPDMDCNATSDNRSGKLMHFEEVPIDNTETVLLNYSNGEAVTSCGNILPSVEFAAIQDPGVEYIGCEIALENNTGHQNDVIDYISENIQTNTDCNVIEGEESRKAQPQNVAVNGKTRSSSLNSRLATKNCDAEGRSQEHHTKTEAPEISKSMLKCNFCTKLFTKNFDLEQHIRSHTGEKPFQCVVCGRAFAQKSNAKKHMQAHKVWPKDQTSLPKKANQLDGKENNAHTSHSVKAGDAAAEKTGDYPILRRSYACQFCNATFSVYLELKSHMKKHSDQKVYKCIQKSCLQTFSDLESFLTHTNNAHVTGLQYRCHVCNKKFNSLESLGLHQYSHGSHAKSSNKSLTRGLVCCKCKRKFKTHAALEHHLDTTSHHFPCPYCGKVFTWERYLRRHLTTHGPEESYPCPECKKCFRTEPYLKAHMVTHSDARPFECQQCGATFSRRDKLARHSLTHQAVKKYKCPFHSYLGCSRVFSRQDKLKRHILTHTAAKPGRCKNCSKTFWRPSQLREHEKLHCHKEPKWKCVDCGTVFKSKFLLSSHACSSVYASKKSGNVAATSAAENSTQSNEDGIKKRKVPLSKRKRTRKNEVSNIHHKRNRISANDSNTCRDKVSTIEIIVVPFSASHAETAENMTEEKNVCIIYPSEETNAVPADLLNSLKNLRNSECGNLILPKRKDCVESIPALKITKNSRKSTDE